MRWFDCAEPQHDVTAALAREDTRVIGVCGYAPLRHAVRRPEAAWHGIQLLSGTSDAIVGPTSNSASTYSLRVTLINKTLSYSNGSIHES